MRIIAPNENAQMPAMQTALLIMMPTYFHPKWERLITGKRVGQFDFYKLKFWKKILVSKSVVHHTRSNPRTTSYMANLMRHFIETFGQGVEFDLLVDGNLESDLTSEFLNSFRNVWVAKGGIHSRLDLRKTLQALGFDTVVLLYADAIGLGWRNAEKLARQFKPVNTIVVNGRKRIFYLDPDVYRGLLWRRALEWLWVLEISIAFTLVLVSLPLAIYDFVLETISPSRQ